MRIALLLVALAYAAPAHADPPAPIRLCGHDGHGRAFDLASTRGHVVALTFASRYTARQADQIHEALLRRSGSGALIVVDVVDLDGVPSLFQGYARRRVAEHDRPGRVLHLIDDGGVLRRQLGADPMRRVDILILDRRGALRGRFVGPGGLPAALSLVDTLSRTPDVERAAK